MSSRAARLRSLRDAEDVGMQFTTRSSSRAQTIACALCCLMLTLAGCGSAPVPLVARAGTTFGMAIGGDNEKIAFGTADRVDPQRGALIFELLDADTNALVTTLPARLVTRVAADPASDAGFDPQFQVGDFTPWLFEQAVALVDIPSTVPGDLYKIKIRRAQNTTGTPAIDNSPADSTLWTLEILPASAGDQDFTPFSATYAGIPPFAATPELVSRIVPNPKLVIALPANGGPVKAATMEIVFPGRATIKGAIQEDGVGDQAILTHEILPGNRVKVHFVNAGPLWVTQIALVFSLSDTVYAPLAKTDFTYVSGTFWDENGVPVTPLANYQPFSEIR
jgi:hypothetical protein